MSSARRRSVSPRASSRSAPLPKSSKIRPDEPSSTWISDEWLSENPSKREGELFLLKWSLCWISIMAAIVTFRLFEVCPFSLHFSLNVLQSFTATTYMFVGLAVGLPPLLYPIICPSKHDSTIPVQRRYITKVRVFFCLSH